MPFINTKEVGAIVIEIPPADEGSITGTVMDAWQMPLADVGPAGPPLVNCLPASYRPALQGIVVSGLHKRRRILCVTSTQCSFCRKR
jgi:hypothetical protein